MQIATYKEAVNYLESFIGKIRFEITPEFLKHHDPLERMRVLLDLLGNPQDKFKSILVGGTSGKGSTAYLISHILTTAGYKAGFTISPHLQKIDERLQINGMPISDKEFVELVNLVIPVIEKMKKMEVGLAEPDLAPQGAPSYFEILIAMAFLYFVQNKVDIAVVEVGMGGEFDATNTLYPLIAVLTNVSLDHTSVLGRTVQKIARTKVGIVKESRQCHPELGSGSPARRQVCLKSNEMLKRVQHDNRQELIVVTGVKQASVIKIVENRCKEVGVELFRLGKDFNFKIKKESLEGSVFDLTTTRDRVIKLNDLKILLLGRYQVENASLAIATTLKLRKFGFKVSEEDIRIALKTAFFPGRFEILRLTSFAQDKTSSTLVLDGAHNPTKMRAFLSTLKKLYPKNPKSFIVAFKSDKNIKGMLKEILKLADRIIITEFSAKTDTSKNASSDALNIKYLASIRRSGQISRLDSAKRANIKYKGEVIVEKDSKKALDKALSLSPIIVVTGSLYLVGEIRDLLTKPTLS